MWQSLDPRDLENNNGKYVLYYGTPTHAQLSAVAAGRELLLTREGNRFYIYFAKEDKGYQRSEVTPPWWQEAFAQHALPSDIAANIYTIEHKKDLSSQEIEQIKAGKELLLLMDHNSNNDAYFVYVVDKSNPAGYKLVKIDPDEEPDEITFKYLWGAFSEVFKNDEHVLSPDDEDRDVVNLRRLAKQHGWNPQNIVHVQNINGQEVLQFNNFPVYGQVMGNDLKTYFASDYLWNLVMNYGAAQKIIKPTNLFDTFYTVGKLLNLNLSADSKYLLTSGSDGVGENNAKYFAANLSKLNGQVLWDASTGTPITNFISDIFFSAFATISPNLQYVVAGDAGMNHYIWDRVNNKKMELWNIYVGYQLKDKHGNYIDKYDTDGLIPVPSNFKSLDYPDRDGPVPAIQSLNFIDNSYYLRFTNAVPYAILYNVNDLKPIKYFYLGLDPIPSVGGYELDESIATSPSAHVLVVADLFGNLIQYQYNPETMTLHKVMVNYLYKKQR